MSIKFHILAGALVVVIGAIFYFIISGMQREFESARPQIEKESVTKALNVKKRVSESSSDDYAKYLNKNIPEPVVPKPTAIERPKPPTQSSTPQEPLAPEEGVYGGERYWCRPAQVQKVLNPVKCHYSDSCYKCPGGGVIPPENEFAVPFCDNGAKAELYSVECCPNGVVNGEMQCPSQMECLSADSVPENFCSCNNRHDCKYVAIGKSIECVCIQN